MQISIHWCILRARMRNGTDGEDLLVPARRSCLITASITLIDWDSDGSDKISSESEYDCVRFCIHKIVNVGSLFGGKQAKVVIHNSNPGCHFRKTRMTHWGLNKMVAFFQTTFWNAFSWMTLYDSRLRFHWSLFPRDLSTIIQHWFRYLN